VLTRHTSYSRHCSDTILSHPVPQRRTRLVICVPRKSTHRTQNELLSEKQCIKRKTYIYNNTYIYQSNAETVAKTSLQAPSQQGLSTGGSVRQAPLTNFRKTPLYLYPFSEQHLTTHTVGVGEIARVSSCRTPQVQTESNDNARLISRIG
jgi:hypothetical protein